MHGNLYGGLEEGKERGSEHGSQIRGSGRRGLTLASNITVDGTLHLSTKIHELLPMCYKHESELCAVFSCSQRVD